MNAEKRLLLLIVSSVLVLVCLYSSIVDIHDMCYRNYLKTVSNDENAVPDFLPPDTVIIEVEHYERPQKKDYDVILSAVMKVVLSGGFLGWCIYKYREEKKLTEFAEREKRKNMEWEINIMLDKEKRWKEYGKDEK